MSNEQQPKPTEYHSPLGGSLDEQHYAETYRIVGTTGFTQARDSFLALGKPPERHMSHPEILLRLKATPTYEELLSLAGTLPSDIELGVLFDNKDWFLVRGFAEQGRDITGPFQRHVPQKGVFLHTHPDALEGFTQPSIIDVAYSVHPSAHYGVIGADGITEFTGITDFSQIPQGIRDDPSNMKVYLDQKAYYADLAEQLDILHGLGVETRNIPWGEQAEDYWEKIVSHSRPYRTE